MKLSTTLAIIKTAFILSVAASWAQEGLPTDISQQVTGEISLLLPAGPSALLDVRRVGSKLTFFTATSTHTVDFIELPSARSLELYLILGDIEASLRLVTADNKAFIHYADEDKERELKSVLPDLERNEQRLNMTIVDKLAVNLEDNRVQVARRTHAEGIADMRELVLASAQEEAWLYIKAVDLWVELGYQEKVIGTDSSIKVNLGRYLEIIDNRDDVVFYHFHPDFALFDRNEAGEVTDFEKRISATRVQVPILLYGDYLGALPSVNDVVFTSTLAKEFFVQNPDGQFSAGIVSNTGLTTLTPLPEVKRLLETNDKNTLRYRANQDSLYGLYLLENSKLRKLMLDDLTAAIRQACELLSGPIFKINYRPFPS